MADQVGRKKNAINLSVSGYVEVDLIMAGRHVPCQHHPESLNSAVLSLMDCTKSQTLKIMRASPAHHRDFPRPLSNLRR